MIRWLEFWLFLVEKIFQITHARRENQVYFSFFNFPKSSALDYLAIAPI